MINLADRLAEDRILPAGLGGLLVEPDDVGIQVRRGAKDGPEGLQGAVRFWVLLPQATTAAAAASTASGVCFRPAKARA